MVTISDVAKLAGVSIGTVSFAYTGTRTVAPRTRKVIFAAAEQLGYQPNAGARMLAGRKTDILGLSAPLYSDMHVPAQMKYVSSVVESARNVGSDVLLLAHEDAAAGIERVTARSLVDGVVMMAVNLQDERIDQLRRRPVPAVAIGLPSNSEDLISCIDLDFDAAARMSVAALHELGHRSIAVVTYPDATFSRGVNFLPRFFDGLHAACQERGVSYAVQKVEVDRSEVAASVRALRRNLPDFTAIVAFCDEPVQAMLLEALRIEGLSVPNDVSVISACSSFTTEFMSVPLSAIPHPAQELGKLAVSEVLAQINGDAGPREVLLEPEFHDLGSTAPPH